MTEQPLQTHAGCAQDNSQSRSIAFSSVFCDYIMSPGDFLVCLVMLVETDMFDVQVKSGYLDCDQGNIRLHVCLKNMTVICLRT
jgi:hypothetical protein